MKKKRLGPFGYVYFIESDVPGGHPGMVKIGRAVDVESRMSTLKISSPFDLRLLFAFMSEDASALEAMIHQMLAWLHVSGEWFLKTPRLAESLEEMKRSFHGSYFMDYLGMHSELRPKGMDPDRARHILWNAVVAEDTSRENLENHFCQEELG